MTIVLAPISILVLYHASYGTIDQQPIVACYGQLSVLAYNGTLWLQRPSLVVRHHCCLFDSTIPANLFLKQSSAAHCSQFATPQLPIYALLLPAEQSQIPHILLFYDLSTKISRGSLCAHIFEH